MSATSGSMAIKAIGNATTSISELNNVIRGSRTPSTVPPTLLAMPLITSLLLWAIWTLYG